MTHYDVFNGDADGLCALHMLRLAEPRDAVLVTGVKRDIGLVARVTAGEGDSVTVLDLSFVDNREAVEALLARGARVTYYDHHRAGTLPEHPRLTVHLDPDPRTCTARIIDRLQEGRFRRWAVVALFGDNQHAPARELATAAGLTPAQADALRELGELLNYNSYGETVADLHFAPEALYRRAAPWEDPLAFIAGDDLCAALRDGYRDDLEQALTLAPERAFRGGLLYRLPPEAWARRVSGAFGNRLARESPERAHAVVTTNRDGSLRISVRAPRASPTGAGELCARFPTGGGRAAAAGINALPAARLDQFCDAFRDTFPGNIAASSTATASGTPPDNAPSDAIDTPPRGRDKS